MENEAKIPKLVAKKIRLESLKTKVIELSAFFYSKWQTIHIATLNAFNEFKKPQAL
ncbi:MAG TPA: hypothetical protein VGP47_09985 [Parachlamydiaceae bacterium]|nr:hypothetical protein [Parachlamydiaceae bacterium]